MRIINFLIIWAVLICVINTIQAATITSTQQGGAWRDKATWVGGEVPTENDDVVIVAPVEVKGQSYSTANFYTNNLTITATGKITREQGGGFTKMHIHGNFVNDGEIVDNADYFDIDIYGNLTNNGLFKPRTITFAGTNQSISGSAPIQSKNLNLSMTDGQLTATSNITFLNCNVSKNGDKVLNMGSFSITAIADEMSYDGYYGKISTSGQIHVPTQFSGQGKIILEKAILKQNVIGNVTISSPDIGFLAPITIQGKLTIDEGTRLFSSQGNSTIIVENTFTNYGQISSDSLYISDNYIKPPSMNLYVAGDIINYGSTGITSIYPVTNGKTIQLIGDFNGKVNPVQSVESGQQPGGKVLIEGDVTIKNQFLVYADVEIAEGGILNLDHKSFGGFQIRDNIATFTNNGTLNRYHFVNNNWSYATFSGQPGTFIEVGLRDWEGELPGLNITCHNNTTYPGLPSSTKRWWRVTSDGEGQITAYTLKLFYDESILNGQKEENLKVYHSTDEGETWDVISYGEYTTLDTEENSISIGYWAKPESLLTELGDFVISAGDGSVPVESLIKVDLVGRKDIRIGAPNRFTAHLYNLSDSPSESFFAVFSVSDNVVFKSIEIPTNDSLIIIPADSFCLPEDKTELFFIPYLEANEHYSFDVIVEGVADLKKSANAGGTAVSLTGLGKFGAGEKTEDWLADKVNKNAELDSEQQKQYAEGMNLTVKQLNIEKKKEGRGAWTAKTVVKYGVKKVAEKHPLTNIVYKIGSAIEFVGKIKDSVRRRFWYTLYKETGLYGVEEKKELKVADTKKTTGDLVKSWDPNEKTGPSGYGDQNFMASAPRMNYTIFFENKKEASAPAYRIQIFDTLSAVFNPESVVFESTSHSDEGYNWNISRNGNILVWDIQGIELPPNTNPPEGEGYVSFSVELKDDISDGTEATNSATIIFDQNDPITTNTWVNTFDFEAPVTTMLPLQYTNGDTSILISCSVDDKNGSGQGAITYYVSENEGPFQEIGVSYDTQIHFGVDNQGDNSYRFYALATDNVNNLEKDVPDIVEVQTIPLSISNDKLEAAMDIYPNPSYGQIYIEGGQLNNITFELYSLAGKKLQSGIVKKGSNSIDLSGFGAGAYLLKLIDRNYSKSFQVILY